MITWITVLCNSRKLWAIPCRATQDGQVTVDSSEKMWSTGEGNGKPSWSWSSNTLATWCEEPIHWKRPWCWEILKAGEVDDRGWEIEEAEGHPHSLCIALWLTFMSLWEFLWLAMQGQSCSFFNICVFIYLFGSVGYWLRHWGSSLQHTGSSSCST